MLKIIYVSYPLKDTYVITVTLPDDAAGSVTLTLVDDNGQPDILGSVLNNHLYVSPVENGKAVFTIEELALGEHKLRISYDGDEKYPKAAYDTLLNVSYLAVLGDFENGVKLITLKLPQNATGNLVIYNDKPLYGNSILRELLYTIPVLNGRAMIDLADSPVGIYNIDAYYDGEDYDVKEFYGSFRVNPKVTIEQGIIMGENGNIYVDLDNATGHIVIAMDHLDPVVQKLDDGIVNYTFSTDGYFYGNHSVTFSYYGDSFSPSIFNDESGNPHEYPLLVLAKETTGNLSSNANYAEARIYDSDGNLAVDAEGTVTFYINGVKVAVVDIVDGIAKLDISKYKNGKYLIKWEYSGDSKYASSSGESSIDVNRKTAKISLTDLNVVYSSAKQYQVTVKTAQGGIAANVNVVLLVNGKTYRTVKTNAKGVAKITFAQKPGNYKLTAKALDGTITKTLKVKHVVSIQKVKVKRSAKKLTVKVTLKKVDGKYIKGKKITFKFNGKKYTTKTNKKGVAKFTIKKNVLKKLKAGKKVKYQATYLKDTVKKSVKVKK